MSQTAYYSPKTLAEAVDILALYGDSATIVNGGTDIVEKIACKKVNPAAIVYIGNIAELKTIACDDGYLAIGGTATYRELLFSPLLTPFSALTQAIAEIGSPPIRAVGTLAGNIGTAVPAADGNVALIALNAVIALVGKNGQKKIAAKDMFSGYCQTQLKPDELISQIRLPDLQPNTGSAFIKMARRKAQDIAQVSVGVLLTVTGDKCKDITIALGAVGPTAVRAYSLENLIRGQKVEFGAQLIKETFPVEAALRSPRNKPYKETVIGVLTERAILQAYRQVTGGKN